MESDPQQMEITIMPNEVDVIATSLNQMESNVSSNSRCCIYKVPEFIAKGKEECYWPSATSIGPVFYKKDPNLEPMQELKRIFLKSFREHPDNARQTFEPYIEFVKEREREIRECYQEKIDLPSDEFIQLIVLDSAFLIFLFLRRSKSDGSFDRGPSKNTKFPIIQNKALRIMRKTVWRDIMLEENQLPFFVLEGMYDIAFGEVSPRLSFIDLALQCIGRSVAPLSGFAGEEPMKSLEMARNASCVVHLVDLMRRCLCLPFDIQQKEPQENAPFPKFYNAKHLSDSGIKFKSSPSDNPSEIKFDKRNGVLTIPKLTIYDETEPMLRSIVIFEQCHLSDRHFTSYIFFMDGLIDTVDDIQILAQNGIFNNQLGSDEYCADLFNKLTTHVNLDPSKFIYLDGRRELEDYITKPCNKWKAIFWSKYFNHPWTIISVIAAAMLFVLTLLQTITGFLQLK